MLLSFFPSSQFQRSAFTSDRQTDSQAVVYYLILINYPVQLPRNWRCVSAALFHLSAVRSLLTADCFLFPFHFYFYFIILAILLVAVLGFKVLVEKFWRAFWGCQLILGRFIEPPAYYETPFEVY